MSQTLADAAVKEIDGHVFEVLKLEPMTSLQLLRRLMAAIGPSIGSALNGADVKGLLSANVDLGRALGELFDRIDEGMVNHIVKTFRGVSFVDGKKVDDVFSAVFRGKLPMMLGWLRFCLESEYGETLGKARSAIDRAIAEVAQQFKSPSQSTSGTSGPSSN